jgi:hypothetical protein
VAARNKSVIPKSQRDFEKWAKRIISHFRTKLLLERHTIILEASESTDYFECSFRPPYLDNAIRYNPSKVKRDWDNGSIEDLKHALIHELCHVLTDNFYGKATNRYISKDELNDERETLTDHIAMIVERAYPTI